MTAPHKAIFLDRDGVLNNETGEYVWQAAQFVVSPGVPGALARLKAAGYLLIVVTNQAGIAKGLYTAADVQARYAQLQAACGDVLDALYFSDNHPSVSESIFRKPDSGMLEKAVARFALDPAQCWIVGDRVRDMEAGARLGIRGILVGHTEAGAYTPYAVDLAAATDLILNVARTL